MYSAYKLNKQGDSICDFKSQDLSSHSAVTCRGSIPIPLRYMVGGGEKMLSELNQWSKQGLCLWVTYYVTHMMKLNQQLLYVKLHAWCGSGHRDKGCALLTPKGLLLIWGMLWACQWMMLLGDKCCGPKECSGHVAGMEEAIPRFWLARWALSNKQKQDILRWEDSLLKGITMLVGQSGRCRQRPGQEAEGWSGCLALHQGDWPWPFEVSETRIIQNNLRVRKIPWSNGETERQRWKWGRLEVYCTCLSNRRESPNRTAMLEWRGSD